MAESTSLLSQTDATRLRATSQTIFSYSRFFGLTCKTYARRAGGEITFGGAEELNSDRAGSREKEGQETRGADAQQRAVEGGRSDGNGSEREQTRKVREGQGGRESGRSKRSG